LNGFPVALVFGLPYTALMTKTEAIQLLGGTAAAVARAVGITPVSVSEWPEELPPRIADRVQAALWRKANEANNALAQAAITNVATTA